MIPLSLYDLSVLFYIPVRFLARCKHFNFLYVLNVFHYTLYTIHYALRTIHYTLYTIHFKLYTLYYTSYTIHYTLYTVHYLHCPNVPLSLCPFVPLSNCTVFPLSFCPICPIQPVFLAKSLKPSVCKSGNILEIHPFKRLHLKRTPGLAG